MSRFFFRVFLLLVVLAAMFISAMNAHRVDIELAFARFASPLGLALVISFACGLLAGLAWQIKWVAQLLRERGRLRRALRLAESKAREELATDK